MQNTLSNSINVPVRERGGQGIAGAVMPPVPGIQQSQNKKMIEVANIRANVPRSLDKYAHEYHQVHGQKIATMGGVPNNHHNYMYQTNQTVGQLESISQRMI